MPRIKKYRLLSPRATGSAIPTSYFRDWLEPKIMAVGRDSLQDGSQAKTEGKNRWNGGQTIVSERAAKILTREAKAAAEATGKPIKTHTFDAMFRRITGILAEETDATSLHVADALILACDDLLSQTDLPVLPTQADDAYEMVSVHNELQDAGMTEEEVKALARQLERFAVGFFNGARIFGDPAARQRERARAASQRSRRMREFKKGSRCTPMRMRNNASTYGPRAAKRLRREAAA